MTLTETPGSHKRPHDLGVNDLAYAKELLAGVLENIESVKGPVNIGGTFVTPANILESFRELPEIDTRDLLAFLTVIEHGNYAAASTALGLNSSGVHRRVQKLEQSLGTKLLTRHTKPVSATLPGERLQRMAMGVLWALVLFSKELRTTAGDPGEKS